MYKHVIMLHPCLVVSVLQNKHAACIPIFILYLNLISKPKIFLVLFHAAHSGAAVNRILMRFSIWASVSSVQPNALGENTTDEIT